MEYAYSPDIKPLSAEHFIGRVCTLLLILFCLTSIIGYINLPFAIPVHFTDGMPDKFGGKEQLFIIPAIGLAMYMVAGYFELLILRPAKKVVAKKPMAYYRSLIRFIGILKVTILLAGIFATAFSIHAINISNNLGRECTALAALLIFVPLVFMLAEVRNMRVALKN